MLPLLQVSGLGVDYVAANEEVVHALRNLTLEVCPGETLGILGQSGSGKSSLALALLRLLPENAQTISGDIRFKNKDLLRASSRDLKKIRGAEIALIFQEPALALNPVLPVGRQIADVLRAHKKITKKEAIAEVHAFLRQVGFDEPHRIAGSYPHELSGGQRQRIAIAQALICRPKLLIADEPLSSLDTVTQAEVLVLLQQLKQQMGLTIIFITHDGGVLSSIADRVAVMHHGQVIATGSIEQLRNDPDPLVEELVAPATVVKSTLRASANGHRAPLLEARQLRKRFIQRRILSKGAEVDALSGTDIAIPRNKILALVGRSGSGKSTLARCLAGLEEPNSGDMLLDGKSVKGSPESLRQQVQLVFQDATTACNPRFTAYQLIAEPLEIAHWRTAAERRQRVRELMSEVELDPDSAGRMVREFSGGQRQRLALARALALEPRLLVLDESLSGLDAPLQSRMVRLLLTLQKKHGLAYLYISHDLNFVSLFAETILVMHEGSIVEVVEREQLGGSTQPETLALVDAVYKLHSEAVEAAS